jgi:oxaloacetate decarboxylase beta subunit
MLVSGFMEKLIQLWNSTGLFYLELGHVMMVVLSLLLLFLAIKKNFEPLLLVPIGFGGLLANIPGAGIAASAVSQALQFGTPEIVASIQNVLAGLSFHDAPYVAQEAARSIANSSGFSDGILFLIYQVGLPTGVFPLLVFMGVGAMTDFGPLLANPKTLLLGAAAQFGIFASLLGAHAASIGIIGGADGPTAIFVAGRLSPELLGAIAVAAYSYMALVPLIQPPIIRALTTQKERAIKMDQLRHVSQLEKIMFPLSWDLCQPCFRMPLPCWECSVLVI